MESSSLQHLNLCSKVVPHIITSEITQTQENEQTEP